MSRLLPKVLLGPLAFLAVLIALGIGFIGVHFVRSYWNVRFADRVESFRVHELGDGKNPNTEIDGFKITKAGPLVQGVMLERLRSLLLTPSSYSLARRACEFEPGVAFRFHRGETTTDVLICFPCMQMTIDSFGPSFDPMRRKLAQFSADLFGDDDLKGLFR